MKNILKPDSRVSLFFETLLNLVIVNVMFLFTSIPIVTIGASFTAMHLVTSKMVRSKDDSIVKTYFEAFKRNFRQATLLWLLLISFGIILYLNISFIGYLSGILYMVYFMALVIFLFLYLSIISIVYFYTARYENTIKQILINIIQMLMINIHYGLLLLAITTLPWIVFLSSSIGFVTGLYFFTFGGFALLSFMKSFILKFLFNKYE